MEAPNVSVSRPSAPSLAPIPPWERDRLEPERREDFSVAKRWTPRLAEKFTAVPNYLLHNIHRLKPEGGRCLNGTEVVVLLQLASVRIGSRPPRIALTTVAKRMGVSTRTVREAVRTLEGLGYLRRIPDTNGGANRYDFTPLIEKLEAMMDDDADAAEQDEG